MSDLSVRRATEEDADPIWRLANDPVTRENFFTQRPIPWNEHLDWFRVRIRNDVDVFWVAELAGSFAGYVRYNRSDTGAEISIAIVHHLRGRGIAARLLELTFEPTIKALGCRRLRARIKASNESSLRAFQKAGFSIAELVMERTT